MIAPMRFLLTASPSPAPGEGAQIDPARVTPGLIGLFFFLALAVAVFFLWRSMNTQLKRIRVDREGNQIPEPPAKGDAPQESVADATGPESAAETE